MFTGVDYISNHNFLEWLKDEKTAHKLKITNISDLEKSKKGKICFYVDFEDIVTGRVTSIDYHIDTLSSYGKPEILQINSTNALYPIISYATGLKAGAIQCNKEDLNGALKGLEFWSKVTTTFHDENHRWALLPVILEEETED